VYYDITIFIQRKGLVMLDYNKRTVDYNNTKLFPREYTDYPKSNPRKDSFHGGIVTESLEDEKKRAVNFMKDVFGVK
jgi:hypothetical protein